MLDPSNDDDTRSDTGTDPKTTDSRTADAGTDPEPTDPRAPPPDARESVPEGSPNRGPPRGDTLVAELRNAQELDPLCRRLRRQLHTRTQLKDPSLALEPHEQHLYSVDEDGLLRRVGRVLVPIQESLRGQLLELYHDSPFGGH